MAEKKGKGKEEEAKKQEKEEAKKVEEPKAEKKEKPKAETAKVEKKEKPKVEKKPVYKIKKSKAALSKSKERSRLKKQNPTFKRQNLGKKKKVKNRWRTSRGIDAGQRIKEKGKPAIPEAGYSTAHAVRGLHPSGYQPVRVFSLSDLDGLNPEEQAIIIAGSVGKRKRSEMQKAAEQRNIQVLNFK